MRVLVVDDSAFQRMTLASALRGVAQALDVETAASGEEAIACVAKKRYDLVTLDLVMPGMDGFAVLRWLMANRPVPVLIISDRRHDRSALLALEMGAFAVMGKPSARDEGMAEWKAQLVNVLEEAAHLRLEALRDRTPAPPLGAATFTGTEEPHPEAWPKALVVASSTGGPAALRDLFSALRPVPVIVGVAQHLPAPFTRSLAARLQASTRWDAREAEGGEEASPGTIWVSPGGRHLTFERRRTRTYLSVTAHSDRHRWCPSADLLFASAARAFGPRVLAVVLTGMGDDGAEGARAVVDAGGQVICESRETSVVPGMPDAVARSVPSALRLPLPEIGEEAARRLA